jgi:subfamily B ATP-binding cassette protein MsbA
MIVAASTTAMLIAMIQPALDKVFINKDQAMLMIIPPLVILLSFINGGANYMQNYLMKFVGQRIISDVQVDLYRHLINADLAFLHLQSSGHLISRFTNDIITMRGAVSNLLTGLAKELATVVLLIALMFYQNLTLACISFVVFPIAIYPIIAMGRRMRKVSRKTQEELGKYTSLLDETFQNIRAVKAYVQEEAECNKAKNLVNQVFQLYLKAAHTDSLTSPIMETLGGVIFGAIIWYGGKQVMHDALTPGELFTFIAAFLTAYRPIKTLSSLNSSLQEGLAAARRLFQIMDVTPKVSNQTDALPLQITEGAMIFDNLTFGYSKHLLALQDVSFTIMAGKTTAFVGESGSGKSTLINLILRFYDPVQGRILIDGQDIKNCTLHSLRKAITVVSQDIMLFDDSVWNNIAYGTENVTEMEVIQAAKDAAAHDFIMSLPEGYQTIIGQQGLKLSGGQKQRISIARGFLKNSPILLLDEATSSLDPITEHNIQQALNKLRKNRTNLIIAHRLSTIIDADQIFVMNKGRVVECGTHAELLSMQGHYFKLYDRQENTGE